MNNINYHTAKPSINKSRAMAAQLMLLLLLVHLLHQTLETDAKVPAVIVFGDSTVDPGNNNQISTVLRSNFEPYGRDFPGGQATGRFSNGKLATDFVSEAFGIKPTIPAYLDPAYNITDFATGVSFASAGTGYDDTTSDVLSVIPIWRELEHYKEYQDKLVDYLKKEKASELLGESLYMISMGTNDFLENYYMFSDRSSKYSIEEYQDFLVGIAEKFIKDLYQLGARKIATAGLVPMGCLPLERTTNFFSGSTCIEEYNHAAKTFNEKLQGSINQLEREHSDIQLAFVDLYDIVAEIVENPDKFGFENVERACCGTGYFEMSYLCNKRNPFTCSDASKYVFWDSFHPTEKTNAIVADYIVKNSLSKFR